MKAGRPSKLSQELQQRICDMLRVGAYIETAAAAVGIHRATLHLWLAKGKQDSKGKYHDFYTEAKKAQGFGELRLISKISSAADHTWQAALALLERRHPKRWGKRTYMQVDTECVEKALDRVRERVSAEAYDALIEALAEDDDNPPEKIIDGFR